MYWEVYLECPECGKRHLEISLAFSPEGVAAMSAVCCNGTIGLELSWEDAMAGATRQEELYLQKTAEGKKTLRKQLEHEN